MNHTTNDPHDPLTIASSRPARPANQAGLMLPRSHGLASIAMFLSALALALGIGMGLHGGPSVRAAVSECDESQPGWFAQSAFTQCDGCPDGVNDPNRILLTDAPGAAASGDWALHMPAKAEAGFCGGSLTLRSCDGPKRAGCNLIGYEKLHFRTRVRLAEDHEYVHHFLALNGTQPNRYWDSDGNAGCRPNGRRAAGTTLDFNKDHELFFYTCFPDMKCDSGGYCSGETVQRICEECAQKDMPCSRGPECCWGNHFKPQAPVFIPRGRWVCLELMMELNTPGEADGTMAFWVDGVKALEVKGMHWRDIAELQLNKAWLMHYIAGGDAERSNKVWFDDMVVSEE